MNLESVFETGKSVCDTGSELKVFTGINIVMGCLRYPRIGMYWSSRLRTPLVTEKMTRNRFFQLRNRLKFEIASEIATESKENDQLWKVRPLFDTIREVCLELPRPKFVSVDEQMIPLFGCGSVRQHDPNNPKPLALKNIVVSSSDGLVLDFNIYQGTTTFNPGMLKLGYSAASVQTLSKSLRLGERWC
ncbi:hypothetical protein QYM36_012674 [Artemia franciscana]|uniref:PiggyBac transposable element-derived protein domain-containing protein n=1 Tax=Artemia franciscana TaxID=6661 RepID=A0AA88L836_ARTSF|nr:hypothetical protein QYM36_012674 [Artemia franciscana]